MSEERIVSAAVYFDGYIISLPAPARHHNVLHSMPAKDAEAVTPGCQGFLTSTGRFVNRSEAMNVAWKAGQLEGKEKVGNSHILFSEDLW